ncbi:MAG: hypothetical protein GY810_25895, partial [Aureispira sp.]|nr:hypothetical protein [Aureispira sp.]
KLIQLPNSIGKLSQLQKLQLNSNKLERLPTTFRQLTQLDLSNNQLGSLPEDFHLLLNIEILDLSNN